MSLKGGRQGVLAPPVDPHGDSSGTVAGVPVTSVTDSPVRWAAASPCPFVPDPPTAGADAAGLDAGADIGTADAADAGALDAGALDAGAANAGALDAFALDAG